ncbi:MAG: hypothetical protein GY749_25755 [Desulfobacteraceae bacterium]|nr:hypothetical protein [Desulfobacteraceae bacterium]
MNVKEKAQNYIANIPFLLKDAANCAKKLFEEQGQEALGGTTGVAGLVIRFFGKGWIDQYFDNLKAKKLDEFGYPTYCKAAFAQAEKSLKEIQDNLPQQYSEKEIIDRITQALEGDQKIDETKLVLVFNPTEHPAVIFVRESYLNLLSHLEAENEPVEAFLRHFNENIEKQVKEEFGDDYEDHLKEVEEKRLKDNEIIFLKEMQKLGRIGFTEDEDLIYETTFAKWEAVENFKKDIDEEKEEGLFPIQEIIKEYFLDGEEHINKILFTVADFGKGKSVFLKHYASQLATSYLQTCDGLFPVYFNLRNFGNRNYASESKLGIISNYLEMDFGIKIENDHFKKKNYAFLIDSLDESGELTERHIDTVLESVHRIQRLDTEHSRKNRIIITSRPVDEGLKKNLTQYEPHIIKDKSGKELPHFISVYGFKKGQFNHWLTHTLKRTGQLDILKSEGFIKELIDKVKTDEQFDIHEYLLSKNILTHGELRRPIFAYMLYQLITRNIDFSTAGKIGIYLSFLNLLTKEAKHKHDKTCCVNLKEEFRLRNILHATAALWSYQRYKSSEGTLRKEDICRTIEGSKIKPKDALAKYREIEDFHFLSHSYFGEDGNQLHFQHQSFAEILLAEYYLKVFIKFALDKESDTEDARIKLMLGEPTEQAVRFFEDLLRLLKETATDKVTDDIIEKRRLLFPLMASLSTEEYSRGLYCNRIFYKWYDNINIKEDQADIDEEYVKNWPIDQDSIDKIIELAKSVIESDMNYTLIKAEPKTALFDKEVMAVPKRLNELPPDIDRWLALIVGNELFNNEEKKEFFAGQIERVEHLFDMIVNWNYCMKDSTPSWARRLFRGINMSNFNGQIIVNDISFSHIDFSYSYFKNFSAKYCRFLGCIFNCNGFENIVLSFSNLTSSIFSQIKSIKNEFDLGLCIVEQGVIIPHELYKKIAGYDAGFYSNFGDFNTFLRALNMRLFRTLEGLLAYLLDHKLATLSEIKSWFLFEKEELKDDFYALIDNLQK